jgi:putative ATP-dependent endonuclease of OLD family
VILGSTIKPKTYRKHARRGLCEAMLGKAVIVVEGLTEQIALWAVAEKLEASNENNYPLDLSGVTIFSSDGDGALPAFGAFFKNLGLSTYAFYDRKARSAEDVKKLQAAYDLPYETAYSGAEEMIVVEVPADRQWQLLDEIQKAGEQTNLGIPTQRPNDDEVRELSQQLLKGRKGDGTAGRLMELCDVSDLPQSMVTFLSLIYATFPKPEPIPLPMDLIETEAGVPSAGVTAQPPPRGPS